MSAKVYNSGVYGSPSAGPPDGASRVTPGGSRPVRDQGAGRTRVRRRRDPLWARLLVIFGALLMMTSGGVIAGEKILVGKLDSSLNKMNVLPQGPKVSIKGPVNILLMGLDRRSPTDPTRADSIIIVHIPAAHDKAYLISIPRDSRVMIPAFPQTGYAGGEERINAAFMYGSTGPKGGLPNGFRLLAATITSFTNIQFNAGAIVDFQGFQALVGALGGVTMYVDEQTTSLHIGTDRNGKFAAPYWMDSSLQAHPVAGVKPKVYQVGEQHLAPWEALDYVRQREFLPDGDYGRQRHQQQFVKAVFKEAISKGLTNPTKINSIIAAGGKAFTVDLGGVSVQTWLDSMSGIRDMIMIKTNKGDFNSEIVNGQYQGEKLNADTLTLLRDVAEDNVDAFIAGHPDWISTT